MNTCYVEKILPEERLAILLNRDIVISIPTRITDD